MSKQIQDGKRITMTATSDVKSGDAIVIGAGLVGIAASDAESGQLYALITEGVHPIEASGAIVKGDIVYVAANKVTKTGAAGNVRAGVSLADTALGGMCPVLLNKGGLPGA